jgi:murein DD-endopeptidase MepM/ murein hydrolase activator NlpD
MMTTFSLLAVALLAACQSIETQTPRANVDPTEPVATGLPPPVVVGTVFAPTVGQTIRLPTAAEMAQIAAVGSATSPESQSQPEADMETPPPTPPATYTPPASPQAVSNEHLWLARPVPQGEAVWTDKAYPYGGTRGGLLRPHTGVEFNVPSGTPIMAAASGTVLFAGSDSEQVVGEASDFYGRVVIIEHDFLINGLPVYTLYGHLSEILVNVQDHVAAQSPIAISGASGVADGPHLHFEVRVGENSYASTRNPLLWLYPFPDRGVVAGRVTWSNGALAIEAPLRLRRIDAPSPYSATTTYASTGVNPDDVWGENFALDDVAAGYYELAVGAGDSQHTVNLWVYARQTTFVEIVLDD